MEIIPKVHLIPGVLANPYLLIDTNGLTLIDAGMPGSHRKILQYIKELGYAPKGLRRIIITHSDIDHVGGLKALKEATGARVFSSAMEAEAIAQGKPSRPIQAKRSFRRVLIGLMSRFFRAGPLQVDEFLTEGEVLPVLGGLKVLETPGHTPGHISLLAPEKTILFCGDSMVSTPEGLKSSRPSVTWDRAKADESTRRQAALGATIVCPGHGPVVKDAAGKFPQV